MQSENAEKFGLNEHDAARFVGVSASTLRRDRASGSAGGIPFVRIGARVTYLRPSLEAWLAAQQQVVKPAAKKEVKKTRRGAPSKSERAAAAAAGLTVPQLRARRAGGAA